MLQNENRPTKKYNRDELPVELILNKDAKRGTFTVNQLIATIFVTLFVLLGLAITLIGSGLIPESINTLDMVQAIQEFPSKMSVASGLILILLAKVIWELVEQHRSTDLIFSQVQEHMNFDINHLGEHQRIGIEHLDEENHFMIEIKKKDS